MPTSQFQSQICLQCVIFSFTVSQIKIDYTVAVRHRDTVVSLRQILLNIKHPDYTTSFPRAKINSATYYQLPMVRSTMTSTSKLPFTTRTVCNNAFSYATPEDLHIPKAVPHGLSFAPQALFFALEAIIAHPAPTSALNQPLRKMLVELDQHEIHSYYRLKAYMHYHSNVVCMVRKVQRDKGLDRYERYSAGVRLLLDGITFRDLATAYFEVVGEVERGAEKRKRKGVVMQNEKSVFPR